MTQRCINQSGHRLTSGAASRLCHSPSHAILKASAFGASCTRQVFRPTSGILHFRRPLTSTSTAEGRCCSYWCVSEENDSHLWCRVSASILSTQNPSSAPKEVIGGRPRFAPRESTSSPKEVWQAAPNGNARGGSAMPGTPRSNEPAIDTGCSTPLRPESASPSNVPAMDRQRDR